MKISSKLLISLISSFLFAIPAHSSAQEKTSQEKTAPPPPKLEKLEEGPESDLKLIKPETNKLKTQEKREGGRVTEVQVRTGKSTYTVKPNQEPKGTREGDANRGASWKVLEFGGKKEEKEVQSLPVLAPGPHSTTKTGTTKPATEATPAAASAASASSASAAAVKK